ncbi:putative aarF domain-containing protein kinase 5, partial [Dryobates pubescens]
RSLAVGLQISLDYWWTLNVELRGVDEESAAFAATMSRCHRRGAERLLMGALRNGGLYIKLGQGLCSFGHILPPEYGDILQSLEDKALRQEHSEVDRLFLEDFQTTPAGLFQHFDYQPLAAASLAQVHRATLPDGTPVAVKVQSLALRERFHGDIRTLELLLRLVGALHPAFGLGWVLQELKGTLAQELDFEQEGLNAERCARDAPGIPGGTVSLLPCPNVPTVSPAPSLSQAPKWPQWPQGVPIVPTMAHPVPMSPPCPQHLHYPKLPSGPSGPRGSPPIKLEPLGCFPPSFSPPGGAAAPHRVPLPADYFLFCEILLQRPLGPGPWTLANVLTKAERDYMQEMVAQRFEKVVEILRALPRPMLLVFRNLNTVRSINAALGAPVDRYFLMAKSAVRSWSRLTGEKVTGIRGSSFCCWLRVTWESLKFEVALRLDSLSLKVPRSLLRFLSSWGLLPHSQQLQPLLQ